MNILKLILYVAIIVFLSGCQRNYDKVENMQGQDWVVSCGNDGFDDMIRFAKENVALHDSFQALTTPEEKNQWFKDHMRPKL